MISKVECVIIECDNCGEIFESNSGFSIFVDETDIYPEESGWHKEGDKHYCSECHTIDDDDNLIIDESRTKVQVSDTTQLP